jgi:hypothetical protein
MIRYLVALIKALLGGKNTVPAPPRPAFRDAWVERVYTAMLKRGDPVPVNTGEQSIFYVRGLGLDRKPNNNPFDDRFNDYCGILGVNAEGPYLVAEYPCTIDPGKKFVFGRIHWAGGASIKSGFYRAWKVGMHPMSRPNHEALVQIGGSVTVFSDDNEDGSQVGDSERTGYFGINQHGPGTGFGNRLLTFVGMVSAGCLVRPSMPLHRDFMAKVKQDIRYKKNPGQYVFGTSIFNASEL